LTKAGDQTLAEHSFRWGEERRARWLFSESEKRRVC